MTDPDVTEDFLACSLAAEQRAKKLALISNGGAVLLSLLGMIGVTMGGAVGTVIAITMILAAIATAVLLSSSTSHLVLSRALRREAAFESPDVSRDLLNGLVGSRQMDKLLEEGRPLVDEYTEGFWDPSSSGKTQLRYRESSYFSSELYDRLAVVYLRIGAVMLFLAIVALVIIAMNFSTLTSEAAVQSVLVVLVIGIGIRFYCQGETCRELSSRFNFVSDRLGKPMDEKALDLIANYYELHRATPPVLPNWAYDRWRDEIQEKWDHISTA